VSHPRGDLYTHHVVVVVVVVKINLSVLYIYILLACTIFPCVYTDVCSSTKVKTLFSEYLEIFYYSIKYEFGGR